ncbi:MAG: ATP-binding protein [Chloroflexi bacterium]|nr:MAG: ATP-binding protein [Chloroflexota bacterium]
MAETMAPVFICPTLVGRQIDLTALHVLIERKIGGQGQAILICGEAGIGKSRLVAEAKIYAAQRDFLLLEGHCFQTDSALPRLYALSPAARPGAALPRPGDLSRAASC